MAETRNSHGMDAASDEGDWWSVLRAVQPLQVLWGTIFLGIATGLYFPAFLLTLGGLIVYLWIIPLATVPVVVFQLVAIVIAGTFALISSKTIVDYLRSERDASGPTGMGYADHLLRLSIFVMALFGSPIYFWNVSSLVLGNILLWKGKHKAWQVMGFVAILWTLLVQVYIFTSLWR